MACYALQNSMQFHIQWSKIFHPAYWRRVFPHKGSKWKAILAQKVHEHYVDIQKKTCKSIFTISIKFFQVPQHSCSKSEAN